MAALNRDSVLSKTSTGSVEELPDLRPDRPDTLEDTRYRYDWDYASTEALLNEQIGLVTKNRRKIKRLKTNFFILIVFLVIIIFSLIFLSI